MANVAHDKMGADRLEAWEARRGGIMFFSVPYAATGTVITVATSVGTEWCKVLFPQGVGWVMSRHLEVV